MVKNTMPRKRVNPLELPPNPTPAQRAIYDFLIDNPDVSVSKWAKVARLAEGTIRAQIRTPDRDVSHKTLTKLNDAAMVLTGRPLTSEGRQNVRVLGRVSDGSKVQMLSESALEEARMVPTPIGLTYPGLIAALDVVGDAMAPNKAGTLVYYRVPVDDEIHADELEKHCVIKLRDGTMFIGEMSVGRKPARFDIRMWNGETLTDQDVIWSAKILSIVPPP